MTHFLINAAIVIAGLVVSVYINVGGRLWLERRAAEKAHAIERGEAK